MSQQPPRSNLYPLQGGRKDNPEHPYRTAFIMSLITGAGAVIATLVVQGVISRATRRGRQEEFVALQQQQPMFAPFPPMMAPQPGGYVYMQPGMQMPMPMQMPMMQQPPAQGFPQALTYQTKSSRRPAPANDTPPEWFSMFVKKQDARFKKLEAQLADDDEYEEDETG